MTPAQIQTKQPERSDDAGATTLLLGWREWIALPQLGLTLVKAKVDTGARTSTLHAFYVDSLLRGGARYVRFGVHPIQKRTDIVVHGEALLIDQRQVTDSGGHREDRFVIQTPVVLAGREWSIEVTLTNRETMLFRMLLGRTALAGQAQVDPARSFLTGRVVRPWERYGQAAAPMILV